MADSPKGLIPSSWGDEEYTDATIIMGQKKWPVHCLVICKQSEYFQKALKGHFEEAQTKTINLTGCEFLEEEVDALLKYLYTGQLEQRQKQQPIRTYLAADYFKVIDLRDKAAKETSKTVQQLITKSRWVGFKDKCRYVLGEYPETALESIIIKVIANNARVVMYESGAWGDFVASYPGFANKVLHALVSKPTPATGVKRPSSVAVDDDLPAVRRQSLTPLTHGSAASRSLNLMPYYSLMGRTQ